MPKLRRAAKPNKARRAAKARIGELTAAMQKEKPGGSPSRGISKTSKREALRAEGVSEKEAAELPPIVRAALELEVLAFGDDDLEEVAAQLAAAGRVVRGPGDDPEHDAARALLAKWAEDVRRLRRDGKAAASPVGAARPLDVKDRARRVALAIERVDALEEHTPTAIAFAVLDAIGGKPAAADVPGIRFWRLDESVARIERAQADEKTDAEALVQAALRGFGVPEAKDWTKRGGEHHDRRRQARGT